MNRIAMATSSRDISAQMMAMLLSALSITLLRVPRASISSLSLMLAGQPNRHGPGVRVSIAKH